MLAAGTPKRGEAALGSLTPNPSPSR